MKRVVVFEGEKAAKRFELCRIAILGAGDAKGPRNRETIRREARLLDAFDAVSAADPKADEKDPDARVLKPEGGSVTISQEDHVLLATYLDTTPWMPRIARAVVDAQDWLSAAEKVEG